MPRRARIVAAGYRMRVILRGIDRAAVFFEDRERTFFLETLGAVAAEEAVGGNAYVLMTNHVHLLMTGRRDDGVAAVMKRVARVTVACSRARSVASCSGACATARTAGSCSDAPNSSGRWPRWSHDGPGRARRDDPERRRMSASKVRLLCRKRGPSLFSRCFLGFPAIPLRHRMRAAWRFARFAAIDRRFGLSAAGSAFQRRVNDAAK